MKIAYEWRLAFGIGIATALVVSLAGHVYESSASQGIVTSLCEHVALMGLLGYMAGLVAVGSAHAGPPPIVGGIAFVVNAGLYTLIAYGIIRIGRFAIGRLRSS